MSLSKSYLALKWGEKVPRKAKKIILGQKMSNRSLKDRLSRLIINDSRRTMWDPPYLNDIVFCHKCGCNQIVGSGNRVQYPEHWETFHCLRCKTIVGEIDNSPFYTTFEQSKWEL